MRKGFTVIEVVVVIGIIAVLSAIIFPALNNIRAKNRDTERLSDISAIQMGLSLYKSKTGAYPADIMVEGFNSYVTAETLLDPDGNPYRYMSLARLNALAKCVSYHLAAELDLPNAQIDTADTFNSISEGSPAMNGYYYCTGHTDSGIDPNAAGKIIYHVHPN